MATINATISIASNAMTYPINIGKTMTMKKLGLATGLENTDGLSSKKFAATSYLKIIEADDSTSSKASKVYVRNTGSSKTDYFYIAINASAAAAATAETIGRLYGGDWMLIPYEGATDLGVQPSTVEPMTLEYCMFYE